MKKVKFVVEINPRTKEKKMIDLLDYEVCKGFTIKDLIEEHNQIKEQLKTLKKLNTALVDTISKINTSTAVQLADIKEEIKK